MHATARKQLKEWARYWRQVKLSGHPVLLALRYLQLYFTRHFSPDEIHFMRLLDPALSQNDLQRVTSKEELLALQNRLNDVRFGHLTEDKLAFHAHCARARLPVPALIAALSSKAYPELDGPVVSTAAEFIGLMAASGCDRLILKPANGTHGAGVTRLHRAGAGWAGSDNEPFTAAALDGLIRTAGFDTWLLEKCVAGHSWLVQLSNSATLQTYRIATLVDRNHKATVLYGQVRLACGLNDSDNFHDGRTGNIIATVDVGSGRITSAIGSAGPDPEVVPVRVHPATGRDLIGFTVPYWTEALELAKRAADAFYPLVTVGWDVAAGERSVYLIEGNVTWDPPNEMPDWSDIHARLSERSNANRDIDT